MDSWFDKAREEINSRPTRPSYPRPGTPVSKYVPPDPKAAATALADFESASRKTKMSPGPVVSFRSIAPTLPPRTPPASSFSARARGINASSVNESIEAVVAELQEQIRKADNPRQWASKWLTALTRGITEVISELDNQED